MTQNFRNEKSQNFRNHLNLRNDNSANRCVRANTITSQPLPAEWLDSDIGNVVIAGSATYSGGTFTINAAGGYIDTSGTANADAFHFVYQSLSGDGAITARVSNIQPEYPGSQVGVMIRDTLDPGAMNAFVWYYPNTATLGYRTGSGASASLQGTFPSLTVGYYPYWVKLARIGNAISAYISQDGQNWTHVGTSQAINFSQTAYFGLGACSCNGTLGTTTFDNVSVTSGTMPLVSGITPTVGTIGTSVTINGSSFGSSQGASTVRFNGALASSITSWADTQIVAVVPANASSGPVSVIANSIESNTDVSFTFYHPVITSLSPSTGQIGATVTVKGSGFGPWELAGFYVLFNGVPVTAQGISYGYVAWNDTSITVSVPSTTSGPVMVSLQGITSNAVQFNVEQLSITGLSPNFGPSGSPITITGTGFGSSQDTSVVDFYGTPAAIQIWSDNQIVAIVPAGTASGFVNVTVGGIKRYGPPFTVMETIQVTDSKGNQSSYTSAMIGGLWVPTVGQGSGCSTCTQRGNISYTYDGSGHPLTRTDENGNATTYTYDSNGNVLTVTVPISPGHSATATYTYNSFGEILTVTDPMGFVTTNIYDTKGNLLFVITPAPGNGASASAWSSKLDHQLRAPIE